MEMETIKQLKQKILQKISEEELLEKYNDLVSKNKIFEKNKRMAYHIIASEIGAEVNVSIASSSKEAFPVNIGELSESEKTNFNLSGYILEDPRTVITKAKQVEMTMLQIADNTGFVTVASFEDNATPIIENGFKAGDFVKLSNLYWPDKNVFLPTFGQYSSITKAEPKFGLEDVVVSSISQLTNDNYFTIKGIVAYLPDNEVKTVLHCPRGHWFSKLDQNDIGTLSMCNKCQAPVDVQSHIYAKGIIIADQDGEVHANIGTFAELDELNLLDEFIFKGKFKDDVFEVSSAIVVKKK